MSGAKAKTVEDIILGITKDGAAFAEFIGMVRRDATTYEEQAKRIALDALKDPKFASDASEVLGMAKYAKALADRLEQVGRK